eukprot:403354215
MLLLKYEKFGIISKDSFLEELLFKYEKNIEHYQKFEKKGRSAISQIISCIDEYDEDQWRGRAIQNKECFEEINESYIELQGACEKIQQLALNQEYVYETFTKAMNQKLEGSENTNTLKEVYKLQKYIGNLHSELLEDIKNKKKVVQQTLPLLIFSDIGDPEENIMLLLDLWTYHNQQIVLSSKE